MLRTAQRLCRWASDGLSRSLRHNPFNLHYFRPCFTAPFHPHFRSLICLRTPGFLLIPPNWLTQGRILPSRLLYPVLQNNGTRCHTQAHTAVSVPFPFHCPATFSKARMVICGSSSGSCPVNCSIPPNRLVYSSICCSVREMKSPSGVSPQIKMDRR